jgi:hypothetical protein
MLRARPQSWEAVVAGSVHQGCLRNVEPKLPGRPLEIGGEQTALFGRRKSGRSLII